jgi:hypothetical protein
MAETQRWQALPTQLERAEFEQFVLPHLSIGSRGPAHPSPHSAADRNPPSSPLLTSISANRCISGSSRCSGMFGISS